MRRFAFCLCAALCAAVTPVGPAQGHELRILGGSVYGPGPMPETPLPPGLFTHVELDPMLSGGAEFFNNGAEPPNIPGEIEIFGKNEGLLSDGAPFNEHVDGGIVTIGQGALRMLAVITRNGPNEGRELYRLDEGLNLRIRTDLALDPGFPEGLIVSEDLDISSGVIRIHPSEQTEKGIEGGFDFADRLPSGAPIFGRLGDSDEDGFLDGEIVGVGRVPLTYIFVPGAPLVQRREFVSDIPVAPRASGLLALANVHNLVRILATFETPDSAAAVWLAGEMPAIAGDFAARAERAAARLERVRAHEAELARSVARTLAEAANVAGDPTAYAAAVGGSLKELGRMMPSLIEAFRDANADGER